MSKITIDDIKAQFASTNSINQRFGQVVDEFNNKVLYRDNPDGEPNNMMNHLDMGEFNIINVSVLDTDTLLVGGLPVGGDHVWGDITGTLSDQIDLYNVLVALDTRIVINETGIAVLQLTAISHEGRLDANDVKNDEQDALIDNKLSGIEIKIDDSAKSLVLDNTNPILPILALTPQVGTKEPFTLVKLDAQGLIPNEQLPFGGAYNSKGVFTVAADPGPYDNPDIRGLGPFNNGDFYSIGMPGVQTEGTVLANTEGVGGPAVPVLVEPGDALLYLEDLATPALTGWYAVLSQGAGGTIIAPDVGYDPIGNLIITPAALNVDAALTDLDALALNKTGDIMTGDIDFANEGDGIIGPGGKAVMRTSAGDNGNAVVIGNAFGTLFLDSLEPVALRVEGLPNTTVAGKDAVDAIAPAVTATIYEALFPIGAYHLHPNPNGVIPGTWVQLAEGTFLMNTIGGAEATGGSNDQANATHAHGKGGLVFTGDALSAHSHTIQGGSGDSAAATNIAQNVATANAPTIDSSSVSAGTPTGAISGNVTEQGEDPIGKNRPLFKGVAIWERTA